MLSNEWWPLSIGHVDTPHSKHPPGPLLGSPTTSIEVMFETKTFTSRSLFQATFDVFCTGLKPATRCFQRNVNDGIGDLLLKVPLRGNRQPGLLVCASSCLLEGRPQQIPVNSCEFHSKFQWYVNSPITLAKFSMVDDVFHHLDIWGFPYMELPQNGGFLWIYKGNSQ